MTYQTAEPKKQLSLDTDWVSAATALCAFFIFALLCGGTVWMNLRGTFAIHRLSWLTVAVAAFAFYVAIASRDKWLTSAASLFAIYPLSRILLWLARSSYETAAVNEVFVRWLDAVLYFGVCVYVVQWFRMKVRHV